MQPDRIENLWGSFDPISAELVKAKRQVRGGNACEADPTWLKIELQATFGLPPCPTLYDVHHVEAAIIRPMLRAYQPPGYSGSQKDEQAVYQNYPQDRQFLHRSPHRRRSASRSSTSADQAAYRVATIRASRSHGRHAECLYSIQRTTSRVSSP